MAGAAGRPKPSTCSDKYWIFAEGPDEVRARGDVYGKWLVFKPRGEMDSTWAEVSTRVESGELMAPVAKVSTLKDNPNAKDKQSMVICVYTTQKDIDLVGMKLVHVVKQTIRYKTDEATRAGAYANRGYKRTTIKTIRWNDGKPFITS